MASNPVPRNDKPYTSYPRRVPQLPLETLLNLGPLALLAGHWIGTGFNTIWRPDNTAAPYFQVRRFLQLNMTSETFDFDIIPSAVPNRGVANQPDITIYGLNYLQKVKDNDTDIPDFPNAGDDLHIEPGLFLSVPQSGGVANANDATFTDPVTPASIVRMATIPHGVSVLLQGTPPNPVPTSGKPAIPAVYPIADIAKAYTSYRDYPPATGAGFAADYNSYLTTHAGQPGLGIQPANVPAQALAGQAAAPPIPTPTFHAVPENTLANDHAPPFSPPPNTAQSNGPFPPSWQAYVDDPNVLLRNTLAGQDVLGFIQFSLASPSPSPAAISQIPFLGILDPSREPSINDILGGRANAFVHSATSTFWIEWVKTDDEFHGPHYDFKDPLLKSLNPFPDVPSVLQLQYSQTVILNFNQVLWPHVSVATLRLHN